MSQVSVTIDGRKYRLACNEGEEARLESLAGTIDEKIGEMRKTFGEIGDQRLVIMAALTLADSLTEARDEAAAQRKRSDDAVLRVQALASTLDQLGSRLEAMAWARCSASSERLRWAAASSRASARLSAMVRAAMMTRRWSPISPNVLRISPIFSSIVPASDSSRASSPSLQARRYLRPSMVTETCDIARAFSTGGLALIVRVRRRFAERAFNRLSCMGEPLSRFGVRRFERA